MNAAPEHQIELLRDALRTSREALKKSIHFALRVPCIPATEDAMVEVLEAAHEALGKIKPLILEDRA